MHPAIAKLKERFPTLIFKGSDFRDDQQIAVPADHLLEIVAFLKTDPALAYDMLADVTCVDYLNYPGGAPTTDPQARFGLVYIFNSVALCTPRLILRVFLPLPPQGQPQVASLVPLYAGAEWMEREVFDMFGIAFQNHPDLRRILTWDSFASNPLRKDYPVTGLGERENFPVLTRESS